MSRTTAKPKRKITLRSIRIGAFRKWLESHPRMQFKTCSGGHCPVARYIDGPVPGPLHLREASVSPWLVHFVQAVDTEHPYRRQVRISGKRALEILMSTGYRKA